MPLEECKIGLPKKMDMEEFALKAPKSIGDVTMKHFDGFIDAFLDQRHQDSEGRIDLNTMVHFVAKFYQIHPQILHDRDPADLQKLYEHIIKLFGNIEFRKPSKYLTINGKEYQLAELDRPSVGFIIDYESGKKKEDPIHIACMCYIPKGTKYGVMDEGYNLLHPIAERYDEFKEHFPMDEYLYLSAFFLRRWERSMTRLIAIERARMKGKRARKKIRRLKRRLKSLLRRTGLIAWIWLRKITAWNGKKS